MFNRSTAFFVAAALFASSMQAKANLIGMPLNLASSRGAFVKARAAVPVNPYIELTDDVFLGPAALWVCERLN
jgi:hypothetical protein